MTLQRVSELIYLTLLFQVMLTLRKDIWVLSEFRGNNV